MTKNGHVVCWIKTKYEIFVEVFTNIIPEYFRFNWSNIFKGDFLDFSQSESQIVHGSHVFS
jgi:hypothetical protein